MSEHEFGVDRAERQQVEQEKQHMDELFRSLIENSLDIITILDAEGVIRYESPSVERVLGYKPAELIGVNMAELLHPQDVPKTIAAMQSAVSAGAPEIWEVRTRHKDGSWRVMESIAKVLVSSSVTGIVVNSRDITKHKQAEKALRESEEKYHSVVDDTPGLIDRFLPDGTITFVNQAYCKFYGKKYDELIGMNIQSTIPEEDRKNVMAGIASLTKESPIQTSVNKIMRHDGEIRWTRWTDRALFDENGKISSYQSFGEDITERKETEEELKISEERFSTFMENVPAFAYILDKNLHHIYGNPASIAADGFSTLDSYIGTSIRNSYSKEISDEIENNSRRVLTEERVTHHEFTVIMRDGKPHSLLDVKFPIRLPTGDIQIGGLAIDITERVQAREAIQLERDNAQKYLDIAKVMIVALNKEGDITLVNQKGASILGYQIEELIGINWFNTCIPTADRVQTKKIFDDFIAGGVALGDHFDQVVITRSGKERIINWYSTPLWEWEGDEKYRSGSLNSGEDITERVQAQTGLQNTLEKLKLTIDGTIRTIAAMVEVRDPYTAGHQKRVSELAATIASEMHLTEQQVEGVRMAGLIHD
ncbi:MAG: PAS domain S-box protein, partial [Pelolinea sp.]|nr:PAS domain S-box protein [Pelolinea sp.]